MGLRNKKHVRVILFMCMLVHSILRVEYGWQFMKFMKFMTTLIRMCWGSFGNFRISRAWRGAGSLPCRLFRIGAVGNLSFTFVWIIAFFLSLR